MNMSRFLYTTLFAATLLVTGGAQAQGNSQGRGHGHDKDKHGDTDDRNDRFRDDDRAAMRGWYADHRNHLPPGLAKRDQLPPGLERQLVVRGTLPPGLQKKIEPCPPDLERRLPPPPPDFSHVVIGGHIVLLNRRTYLVADIFHLEIN
jgi:hypothetical protein